MTESIGNRLIKFLEHKKLTLADLIKMLGYTGKEKIYRIVREKEASPSYDTIADIGKAFPELNLDWWLMGRGSMLKAGQDRAPALTSIIESGIPAEEKINILSWMLDSANAENKRLLEELSLFSKILDHEKTRVKKTL